eukprot:2832358-Ditylum_brightwellii.AAC.1
MKDQIFYSHDYPFNTLELDWDIIAQAAVTLCSYGSRLTMFHVKSHQNNNKEEEELDLPAQLNIAADNLATKYRIQYDQPLPLVPQVAVNSVQLCTTDSVISSHYSKRIQDYVTTPALKQYLKTKHEWTEDVFASIDWNTYQKSKN